MKKFNIISKEYKQLQHRNLKYIKSLRRKRTKAEIAFKDFLDEHGIYYKFQKGFLKPFHRIVDFYIPYIGYIIEIDGEIHDNSIEKDQNKDKSFRVYRGLTTIRIKNSEIFDNSFVNRSDVINLIAIAPHSPRRASRSNKTKTHISHCESLYRIQSIGCRA